MKVTRVVAPVAIGAIALGAGAGTAVAASPFEVAKDRVESTVSTVQDRVAHLATTQVERVKHQVDTVQD